MAILGNRNLINKQQGEGFELKIKFEVIIKKILSQNLFLRFND